MSSEQHKIDRRDTVSLERESRTGFQGRIIPTHRAIQQFDFPRRRLISVLLLPLIFTVLAWPALQFIGSAWAEFFIFWIEKLQLVASVSSSSYGPDWLKLSLPHLDIVAAPLQSALLWTGAAITLFMIVVSPFIPSKFLPLRYLVRVVAFIQTTALLFFFFVPERFPYSLADHLESFQTTGVTLMLILPWVHALIYYIFDFSLFKKIFFTLLTLLFCSFLIPFMVVMHAYVVYSWSLLLVPLLYFVFGMFMLIIVCIALYGWAMSWRDSRVD